MKSMLLIFKRHNEGWSRTLTVMSDKDFCKRNTFIQEFPQATLLICMHTRYQVYILLMDILYTYTTKSM